MGVRGFVRTVGQLGPLAAAATVLPPLGSLLLLGTIQHSSAWLRDNGGLGLFVFVAGFALCGGFALLPTYTPALIGGWAFGLWTGLGATLAGFAGAAAIGFAVARRLSGDRLVAALHQHPRGLAVHDAFVRSGLPRALAVATLVRLPPNSPFALTNVLLAATGLGLVPFLLGTVVGIIPRAAAGVVVGASLATLDLAHPRRSGHAMAAIVTTLVVVGVLGWMGKRALKRLDRRVTAGPES